LIFWSLLAVLVVVKIQAAVVVLVATELPLGNLVVVVVPNLQ
jgi:hypothetical protein